MKFILTFTIKPEGKGRDEAIARFKNTGDRVPPEGAKLLRRWTAADFGASSCSKAMTSRRSTEFSLMWSDIMELSIVPVIEDADLSVVLMRAGN